MTLQLLGLNHKTAPVEIRERLAIPPAQLAAATRALATHNGIEEALVLSTCNRVEFLACTANGRADLHSFLAAYFQVDVSSLVEHSYEHIDRDAVSHLFRVASSLDSQVVGEAQILGQVKQSYAVARQVGAVSTGLDALLSRTFSVARRIRRETHIGSSAVSIASVAVDLASKIFGSLKGSTVLLVGAGKMSELAARHFIAAGAGQIIVANRTLERATVLAATFGGEAVALERVNDIADRADIVLTSTGSSQPIFRKEHGELFLHRRRNRPMFFIDIAVPRDVAPEMNQVDGAFVYDIDDLQNVISKHAAGRRREAERAEQIVASEVDRFFERMGAREAVPAIVTLQQRFEVVRQAELSRFRGKLGPLTAQQEQALEALTRGIVNKLLHPPMTALKDSVREAGETIELTDALRRLFSLDAPEDDE